MASEHPLVIEHLNFSYSSRTELAIKDISLTIDAGQVLLIAGAS